MRFRSFLSLAFIIGSLERAAWAEYNSSDPNLRSSSEKKDPSKKNHSRRKPNSASTEAMTSSSAEALIQAISSINENKPEPAKQKERADQKTLGGPKSLFDDTTPQKKKP
jgi:hypothetical protein